MKSIADCPEVSSPICGAVPTSIISDNDNRIMIMKMIIVAERLLYMSSCPRD